jgi:hypothetical protein
MKIPDHIKIDEDEREFVEMLYEEYGDVIFEDGALVTNEQFRKRDEALRAAGTSPPQVTG